ncbi:UDP-N-acetylglucosamine 1-carboxyvinyltransferase [Patescibacteria group bacterium]|nr:UDP-N-acetylglucosamine 1-carboxyvinyltransferase [Patescibacteria group bacterium]
MENFEITGNKPLSGEITVSGAKNAATALIAASLLFDGKTTLDNVPKIEDVNRMLEIMESMGSVAEWIGENKLSIDNANIDPTKMNSESVCKLRSSVLLIGSLINRFQTIKMPYPGGCQIGARSFDTHILALEKCGFVVKQDEKFLYFEKTKDPLSEILLTEISVTATANVILAMTVGKYKIKLLNADYGYSIQDLCTFLNKAGAKIKLVNSHDLEIKGVKNLKSIEYNVIPDPIETGTFISLAAATKSNITIKHTTVDFLRLEMEKFRLANVDFEIKEVGKADHYKLVDIVIKASKLKAVKRVHDMPYPGFMSDLLPPFAVMMTQAEGTSLIHEWMYEGRLKYVNELIKMGADATICDPHRVIIVGPSKLTGQEMEMSDLRAGATLVIAALVAEGKSKISNIYQVDRGYEKIDLRLNLIGADIKRI